MHIVVSNFHIVVSCFHIVVSCFLIVASCFLIVASCLHSRVIAEYLAPAGPVAGPAAQHSFKNS